MKQKIYSRRYLKNYTVLFALLTAAVFFPFMIAGKSLIWREDGLAQYYPYLHYMGNWLRDSLGQLLRGITPKLYDFSIGMGNDIGAIVRFHPLDFLSALMPGRFTELLYNVLILLRIYLAGLAFSAYALYWKKPEQAVLTGSVVYCFCGYVLKAGIKHPTFLSPMIILPLLFLAAERGMRKKGVGMLSVITALGFMSNYYFMYICSIALFFYVLLRFFDLYREKRVKNFLLTGIRLVSGYLLGAGMTAVTLLPIAARLFSSGRFDTEDKIGNLLYYSGQRWLSLLHGLIMPGGELGGNTYLGYAALALPALAALFLCGWKKHLTLKLAVLLEFLFLMIPAGGFLMSGFSTIGNRWTFIFSFTISMICVAVDEEWKAAGKRLDYGLAAVCAVFALLYVYRYWGEEGNVFVLAGVLQLIFCTLVLLFGRRRKLSASGWNRILLGMVCIFTITNAWMSYGERFGNDVAGHADSGKALESFTYSSYAEIGKLRDDSFYRVDTGLTVSGEENASVILGYPGISMYNSIVNSSILETLTEQENPGANALHRIMYLDGRAVPETLANVKYYLLRKEDSQEVPYGFVLREDLSGEVYQIYENTNQLPLGYTYDAYILREDYDKLDALEKQQVMKDAVVLETAPFAEDGPQTDAPRRITRCTDAIETEAVLLPETGENLERTKKGYSVGDGGGVLRIPYEKREGYECYLHIKGITRNASYAFVHFSGEGLGKTLTVRGKKRTYSLGQENYLICLGYAKESEQDELTITFTSGGSYGLKGLEFCYVPMENFAEDMNALAEESLEQAEAASNTITGTLSLSEEKFLVFSIPSGAGWRVWVDGEERTLQKANRMYQGLWVEAGEHRIRLQYTTPGLKAGAAISLLSLLCFAGYLVWKTVKGKTPVENCSVQEKKNLLE